MASSLGRGGIGCSSIHAGHFVLQGFLTFDLWKDIATGLILDVDATLHSGCTSGQVAQPYTPSLSLLHLTILLSQNVT